MNTARTVRTSTVPAAPHTPGPWRVSAHTNPGAAYTIEADAGFVCDGWGPGSSSDDANAALLAAAPDLLAAAQLAERALSGWPNWSAEGLAEVTRQLRQAIERASRKEAA